MPAVDECMGVLEDKFPGQTDAFDVGLVTALFSSKMNDAVNFTSVCRALCVEGEITKIERKVLALVLALMCDGDVEERLKVVFGTICAEGGASTTRDAIEGAVFDALKCLGVICDCFETAAAPSLAWAEQFTLDEFRFRHAARAIEDVVGFEFHDIRFGAFVQICFHFFYNVMEEATTTMGSPVRSRSDPVLRRFTEDGIDSTHEERLSRRNTETGEEPRLSPIPSASDLVAAERASPGPSGRKSVVLTAAESAADTAAEEARNQEFVEGEDEKEETTLVSLVQDFGLKLFFIGGVRYTLALSVLAASLSLFFVLVNRFDYTTEVALACVFVFDFALGMTSLYMASRMNKLENADLTFLDEENAKEIAEEIPEEVDSILPGLRKMIPSLGRLMGRRGGGGGRAKRKKQLSPDEHDGGMVEQKNKGLIGGFFQLFKQGGANEPGVPPSASKRKVAGTPSRKERATPGKHRHTRSRTSYTEMDFTPYKMKGSTHHSRNASN